MVDRGVECGCPIHGAAAMTMTWTEWRRCRPWIEAALEYCHGTHTIEDVEIGILQHHYQFWPGERSAMVTQILVYPRQRFAHIFLAGGDMDELRSMVKRLLRPYALLTNCSRVTLAGRRGWERALKGDGWETDLVCLGLPIGEIHEQISANPADADAAEHDPALADAGLENGRIAGREPPPMERPVRG